MFRSILVSGELASGGALTGRGLLFGTGRSAAYARPSDVRLKDTKDLGELCRAAGEPT
jgi:hypothetical protein